MPDHPLSDGTFDPLAALRTVGADPARATLLRVLWLRQREPDARIETRLVSQVDGTVVFSAVITLPGAGVAHGHAADRIGDDPGTAFETVENRAIARALDALGYVVPDVSGESAQENQARDEPPLPQTPEPSDRAPEHVRALRQMKERERSAPQPEPEIDGTASPVDPPAELELELELEPKRPAPSEQRLPDARREPEQPAPTTRQAPERPATQRDAQPTPTPIRRETADRPAPPADDADEGQLEDVSWTAFWKWARGTYQVSSKGQLEELLGRPMGNATPGQLRLLMIQHFHSEGSER